MKGSSRVGIRSTIILAVGLAASAQSLTAQWTQWPVTQGGNGHWYQAVRPPSPVSWVIARESAKQDGGYLATITSAEENAFVFNLLKPPHWNRDLGPLIGGYQPDGSAEPGGGWTWVTGEPWGYTNWAAAQPDNANSGTEAALHFWGGSTWNDTRTNVVEFMGYVMEHPEHPRPAPSLKIRFSEVEISWETLTNIQYRVEYRSALTTGLWVTLGTNLIIGNGERHTLYERLPPDDRHRFYRLVDTSDP